MSSQTPDLKVLSPEIANPVPSPSPWERRSPDRPSGGAPKAEPPSAGAATLVSADPRCQYRYQNASRCRLQAADSESGLCPRHLRQKFAAILPSFPNDSADLSSELLRGIKFSSAEDLREYLTRLLTLMTRGGVSPRRASVLAYITTQLLHSHVAAEKEANDESQPFIFDLPHPASLASDEKEITEKTEK